MLSWLWTQPLTYVTLHYFHEYVVVRVIGPVTVMMAISCTVILPRQLIFFKPFHFKAGAVIGASALV